MNKRKDTTWPSHRQLAKLGADVLAQYIRDLWRRGYHVPAAELEQLARAPLEFEYERARAQHQRAVKAERAAAADMTPAGRRRYWQAFTRATAADARVAAAFDALYPRRTTPTTPPPAEEQSKHGS